MEPEYRVTLEGRRYQLEMLRDGKVVSYVGVWDLPMRIEGAVVKMGGLASVGTPREERGKGYNRQMLRFCQDWMQAQGFDCSLLFGIPGYYDRYGYRTCLPECYLELRTRHAEAAEGTLEARELRPEDMPAVKAIYAQNNAALTGSIVRDDLTRWFRLGSQHLREPAIYVFPNAEGVPVAYVSFDRLRDSNPIEHELVFTEIGASHPKHFADIVRFAAQRAIAMRLEKITFQAPPESAFARYLRLLGADQRIHYPANAEGMGRFVNFTSFFEKTRAVWERRARLAGVSEGASLCIRTELGDLGMLWREGELTLERDLATSNRVTISQDLLFAVAMGYVGGADLEALDTVTLENDQSLLHAVFPAQAPYMWRGDHF